MYCSKVIYSLCSDSIHRKHVHLGGLSTTMKLHILKAARMGSQILPSPLLLSLTLLSMADGSGAGVRNFKFEHDPINIVCL